MWAWLDDVVVAIAVALVAVEVVGAEAFARLTVDDVAALPQPSAPNASNTAAITQAGDLKIEALVVGLRRKSVPRAAILSAG